MGTRDADSLEWRVQVFHKPLDASQLSIPIIAEMIDSLDRNKPLLFSSASHWINFERTLYEGIQKFHGDLAGKWQKIIDFHGPMVLEDILRADINKDHKVTGKSAEWKVLSGLVGGIRGIACMHSAKESMMGHHEHIEAKDAMLTTLGLNEAYKDLGQAASVFADIEKRTSMHLYFLAGVVAQMQFERANNPVLIERDPSLQAVAIEWGRSAFDKFNKVQQYETIYGSGSERLVACLRHMIKVAKKLHICEPKSMEYIDMWHTAAMRKALLPESEKKGDETGAAYYAAAQASYARSCLFSRLGSRRRALRDAYVEAMRAVDFFERIIEGHPNSSVSIAEKSVRAGLIAVVSAREMYETTHKEKWLFNLDDAYHQVLDRYEAMPEEFKKRMDPVLSAAIMKK